jgi:hypothetical protein
MMYVKTCKCCDKRFVSRTASKKYCSKDCVKEVTRRRREETEQLCWRCKNACGGCNWSRFLMPIDGWIAESTIVKDSSGDFSSYRIRKCPEFIKD